MDIQLQKQGKLIQIGDLLPEMLQEPVPLDLVELSDEERDEVILKARQLKQRQLEAHRLRLIEEQRLTRLKTPLTPNELYQLAAWRATLYLRNEQQNETIEFTPHDFQEPIIKALCYYWTNHPQFERLETKIYNSTGLPFSLNKGLWLWSNPGQGKTLMMHMFAINKRLCYSIAQCRNIEQSYRRFGDEAIIPYTNVISAIPSEGNFFQREKGLCYNDLGTERIPSYHFSNQLNVMESVFLDSYESKVPFFHRHVTTNLTFPQVKEIYGVRFTDRVRQSFNIIEINGQSLRK